MKYCMFCIFLFSYWFVHKLFVKIQSCFQKIEPPSKIIQIRVLAKKKLKYSLFLASSVIVSFKLIIQSNLKYDFIT